MPQVEVVDKGSHWQTIAKSVRKLDEEKVKDSKEDIDTLLVFVRFRPECPKMLPSNDGISPAFSLQSLPLS